MPYKLRAPAELVGPIRPHMPKWRWLRGLTGKEWVTQECRASVYATREIAAYALECNPLPRNADDLDKVEFVRADMRKEK